jgi:proteic killer suppression protein
VEIKNIRHNALRAFAETGKPKGLSDNLVVRLRNMLAWLDAIEDADELLAPPNLGTHQLSGERQGVWSLAVPKSWRMTVRISEGLTIEDLDLEDYH